MTPDPYDNVRAAFHTVADGLMGWEDPPKRAERRSNAPMDAPPTADIDALEAAAEALVRHDEIRHAITVWAHILQLRSEGKR